MRSPLSHVAGVVAAFPTLVVAQGLPWLHAPIELPPMAGAFSLLGDVDLDGDLDAISFTNDGSAIKTSFSVWANDGTGAFTAVGAPTPLPANAGIHVLFADVDGDGRGDLILSVGLNTGGDGLLLFPGQAGGTFGPHQHLPLPGIVTRLDRGNGNGDGITDLLVMHAGGAFPTRWIFGAAGFVLALGPGTTLPLTMDHCVLDADGDGLDDVALTIDAGPGLPDTVEFHVTTPTGFVPGPTIALPTGSSFHPAPFDHDGDGDVDLLVRHSPSSGSGLALARCINLGGGNWTSAAQTFVSGVNGDMYIGDWNGDGRDDLGMYRFGSIGSPHRIDMYESLGTGGVALRYSLAIASLNGGGPGFGDLNQDGHLDFLDANSAFFGDGTFESPFGTKNTGALRDWDGDGDQDLLPSNLSLHDGNGGTTDVPFTFPPLPANQVYDHTSRLVTDLDGDGRHEMLIGVLEVFFLQTTFRETHLLREGIDHHFTFVGLAAPAPNRLDRGVTDDTDGDGDLDIVNRDGLWLNDGSGFFAPQGAITTGYEPIAKGDVDGDGDQDLLATTTGGGTSLAVLHRTVPNTWSTTVLFPAVGNTIENAAPKRFFDVDDDGDLDVVARQTLANNVRRALVFTNQNGVFTQALVLPNFGPALVGDIDGDGLTDVAFSEASHLHVYRRIGPGLVYAPPVTFLTTTRNDLVDFDQDGDLDATGSQGVVRNKRFHGPTAGHRRQYGNGSLGAGGWRPILSMRGPIREGLTPTMSLRRAPGGTFALLLLGSGPNDAPSIVLPGVQSYVAPIDALIGFTLNGALGQPGAGSIDLPLAIPIGLGGVHAFVEFIVFDPTVPGAFTHSNGCELAIGQ